MKATFGITDWSVWAPGLASRADVGEWIKADAPVSDSGERPDVRFVPAMLRRRLKRLARMQVSVARECLGGDVRPIVFASRDGEIHRTNELLGDLLEGEGMSPAGFSLSVHNSASGVFSIARRDPTATTTVAAGRDTLPMAILEAVAQLRTGVSPGVLLAFADEPLPVPYDAFEAGDSEAVGVGLLMTMDAGAEGYTLSSEPAAGRPDGPGSMGARELLKCLSGVAPKADWRTETNQWRIQRNER